MLTIKHCRAGGFQVVLETVSVEYSPYQEAQPPNLPHIAQVVASGCPAIDGSVRIFAEGTVYVMNDKGRTIATYNLDLENAVERRRPSE